MSEKQLRGSSKILKQMTRKQRLMHNVQRGKGRDDCWIWLGSIVKKSGYGRIEIKGKHYKAHKLSYLVFTGPVPVGKVVCHSCDNPPCTNPRHLWVGTHADNIADRDRKGRTARGTQISNTVKLNEELVLAMRKLWVEQGVLLKPGQHNHPGLSYSELGRLYGVSSVMARNIILRKNWTHV